MDFHNKRFPQQWEIVTKHIDFKGLEVIDLGCGGGDFVRAVGQAGGWATGIEFDPVIAKETQGPGIPNGAIVNTEIKTMWESLSWNSTLWDVAVCFSVLPYLEYWEKTLDWMALHSQRALLEVQYKGDGPGFIEDSVEMMAILGLHWNSIQPIGFTTVEYRNVHRTIWLCE